MLCGRVAAWAEMSGSKGALGIVPARDVSIASKVCHEARLRWAGQKSGERSDRGRHRMQELWR